MGASIRLVACLGVFLDVIAPCAFPMSNRKLSRTALDYAPSARVELHNSWSAFLQAPARRAGRLVLFTTKAALPYCEFAYQSDDTLLFGQESCGVTAEVYAAADARLVIPLQPGLRSLNVVAAAAMALGEALRQTRGFATSQVTT